MVSDGEQRVHEKLMLKGGRGGRSVQSGRRVERGGQRLGDGTEGREMGDKGFREGDLQKRNSKPARLSRQILARCRVIFPIKMDGRPVLGDGRVGTREACYYLQVLSKFTVTKGANVLPLFRHTTDVVL